MNVPDPDDTIRGGVRDPGSANAGIAGRLRMHTSLRNGRKRQDEFRRLGGRTTPAAHHKVDISTPDAGAVVVPDVPVRIDVERGVPVLRKGE